ncbi:unnamed protein product [Protopolystoma xenopodis]|uniref:Secreted protein n=1 Tax=Protopolystoma xenopodis TaxID=117903 RepID=A0A448XFR2_9PLAT|nr:unnamed protein product [Protopolystoma xenopodis]
MIIYICSSLIRVFSLAAEFINLIGRVPFCSDAVSIPPLKAITTLPLLPALLSPGVLPVKSGGGDDSVPLTCYLTPRVGASPELPTATSAITITEAVSTIDAQIPSLVGARLSTEDSASTLLSGLQCLSLSAGLHSSIPAVTSSHIIANPSYSHQLFHENSALHAGLLTALHPCAGNVDLSLPYCYAVLPYVLPQSLSCPVSSVCPLSRSHISLDPCHPICANLRRLGD